MGLEIFLGATKKSFSTESNLDQSFTLIDSRPINSQFFSKDASRIKGAWREKFP